MVAQIEGEEGDSPGRFVLDQSQALCELPPFRQILLFLKTGKVPI